MSARGRQSAAALSTQHVRGRSNRRADIMSLGISDSTTKLLPVEGLSKEERAIWLAAVNAKPPSWFGVEHVPILAQYCRHKASADKLTLEIESVTAEERKTRFGFTRYTRLLKSRATETRSLVSLARSMRITQQSMYGATQAATATRKAKAGIESGTTTPNKTPWQP